ncbi:MAG: FAD-dependent oxidoreductase [Chitinophagaceae bacterium]|nr:FAD-dependent oxidoreductase [Chitinophagaceae bacterium]
MGKAKKGSLIIVGAGAAGLIAASELAGKFQVTVLEASDTTGGRIRTIDGMEAGAEFVHGELPLTMELAKKAGATLEKTGGHFYQVSDCDWRRQDDIIEGWDLLLQKMEALKDDITLDAFLETNFAGGEYEELRRRTRAYASGFDVADPVKASVKALYREWSQGMDEMYRIKEGYAAITDHLQQQCEAAGCRILTNKKVKQADWEQDRVKVYTDDGETFEAQKLILTLPAGIMQRKLASHSINITPPLDSYDTAWEQIGYGSVLKILLKFKEAFWAEQQEEVGFVISDQPIPTWWTQLPYDEPLLTGWIGGPYALQWDNKTDEEILEHAVTSLSRIFRRTVTDITALLESHQILRWHTIETALGAYSYETPLSAEARALLMTPVAGTLYFAGEALYNGPHPGTVEAALYSGKEVAERIIGDLAD